MSLPLPNVAEMRKTFAGWVREEVTASYTVVPRTVTACGVESC
ncbi:hypothetical protein [Roseomonas sp. WA12]